RLDFRAAFHLDGNVPADDQVTSLTGVGGSGPVRICHHALERGARGTGRIRSCTRSARKTLPHVLATHLCLPAATRCRARGGRGYYPGVFAQLLGRRSLSAVRKEKGRLRSYLLGALKYFLADEQRRAMAIKRGKGQRLIPLEELRADERIDMEPSDPMTAEMIYERRWALTVLERVLSRLKDEYRAAGNAALF